MEFSAYCSDNIVVTISFFKLEQNFAWPISLEIDFYAKVVVARQFVESCLLVYINECYNMIWLLKRSIL